MFTFRSMRIACALLAMVALTTGPAIGDGFDDDFSAYRSDKQVLKNYGFGQFAGQGGDRNSSYALDDQADTVTLTASATKDGNEAPSFALAKLIRTDTRIVLGTEPDVTLSAKVTKADMVPFGDKPVAPISLVLSGDGASPSIVGMVGMKRGDGHTLFASILLDREVIAEKQVPRFGKLDGKTLSLVIKGSTVDLTADGESLIGQPTNLGVDLADHPLGKSPLQPALQIQKNFGKQPRSATFASFTLVNQTAPDSVAAVRDEINVSLLPGTAERITPTLGQPRTVSPRFIGYNGNLSSFDRPWDHDDLVAASRELRVATLRYPAGSIGNVWDWDRGWVSADIDYDRTIKWVANLVDMDKRYTLENLAVGVEKVGFDPVFVLNPVHHTLEEHLGHLKKLESMGVEIRFVELGNEYYFGRGADQYIHDKYPTPEAYAKDASRWAAALKEAFPGVEVSAVGSGGGPANSSQRRRTWNENAVPHLTDAVDAITIHKYVGHGLDGLLEGNNMEAQGAKYPDRIAPPEIQQAVYEQLQRPQGVAYMLSRPAAAWAHMQKRTHIPDRDIWLTEYNLSDQTGAVRNTWAHGLFIAAYLDTFLRDGRVKLTHFHNLYGGNLFPALVSDGGLQPVAIDFELPEANDFELTAPGIVLSMFAHAMNGRERATPLEFADAPAVRVNNATYPLAFGWRFQHDDQPPAYLVANLSDRPMALNLADLPDGARLHVAHATPAAFVAGWDSVSQRQTPAAAKVTLPPYCLATITPGD